MTYTLAVSKDGVEQFSINVPDSTFQSLAGGIGGFGFGSIPSQFSGIFGGTIPEPVWGAPGFPEPEEDDVIRVGDIVSTVKHPTYTDGTTFTVTGIEEVVPPFECFDGRVGERVYKGDSGGWGVWDFLVEKVR